MLKPSDFIGDPCGCGECLQAGMSTLPIRRDPFSGEWLHGYALKRWYDAKEQYRRATQQVATKAPALAAAARVVDRQPGEEG
jgi:hypothetical protein